MKKIILIFLSFFSKDLFGDVLKGQDRLISTAFSAGYVFKQGHDFKQVYEHGMVNIITADGCYYFREAWGVGAKISYWRAHGQTTFLKQKTLLQEVPVTFYVRKIHEFESGVQAYASFGGGFAWIKESSYLGSVSLHKGLGEVEAGLSYSIWRDWSVTMATRYLFPPQTQCDNKKDVGGADLRAGFSFSW